MPFVNAMPVLMYRKPRIVYQHEKKHSGARKRLIPRGFTNKLTLTYPRGGRGGVGELLKLTNLN